MQRAFLVKQGQPSSSERHLDLGTEIGSLDPIEPERSMSLGLFSFVSHTFFFLNECAFNF